MSNFNCQKQPIVAPSSSSTENPSSPDDRDIPTSAQPKSILENDPNRLIYPPIGRGDLDPSGQGIGGGMLSSSTENSSSHDPNRLIYPPIGRGDLDPFGQGIGGGMLFDPFSGNRFRPERGPPVNMPRGALPPGARYDPVGPLPDARFFRPDPDHLPPPRGPGFDRSFF
ncbi:proteasome inhibitor pi31 subunit-like protein [Dermatophagoides farinae]|uniref:Proteasome inhibitor pi31 subunit-like protein n=1 Tax=Dermatophagoides farinae TaxID=6954 RepID=A0A9D4SCL8_DERFA|nr:proteasome inhibitor pi31 subunit-like protein [Dermatophagoides farinae]